MALSTNETEDVSVKDIIKTIRSIVIYLKNRWLIIIGLSFFCGALGLIYSFIKKPVYTATSTFVLDDNSKMSALSQYAGLASMAGLDLGGSGTGGLFQTDNILNLYKSRIMIEKALLTKVSFGNEQQLLIERYITFNKLRKQWAKKDNINVISFSGDPKKFSRIQDSLITSIVDQFNKKGLLISKPDKKTSIIEVDVVSNDELFAKEFNTVLVQTVNDFYTQSKTKKSARNVNVLQNQADSIKNVLNNSINGVATAIDASPNANPSLQILKTPSQKKQIDVQTNAAIYTEVVKNLELSKMSLRQETPLIQVIDQPVLPLPVDKLSKLKGFFAGLILGFFLAIFFFLIKRVFQILN